MGKDFILCIFSLQASHSLFVCFVLLITSMMNVVASVKLHLDTCMSEVDDQRGVAANTNCASNHIVVSDKECRMVPTSCFSCRQPRWGDSRGRLWRRYQDFKDALKRLEIQASPVAFRTGLRKSKAQASSGEGVG